MQKWPPDIMGHLIYGVTTAVAYNIVEHALH